MYFAAVLQRYWDGRAAANFMCGGTGGALVVAGALVGSMGTLRVAISLLGLALMGIGLTAVWLEIGRPWRALNVLLRPQNSWMTREAYVAMLTCLLVVASLLLPWAWLAAAAAVAGAGFVFCQGRILRATTGIAAWREPSVVLLIVATAVAEGSAVVSILVDARQVAYWSAALVVLLVLRWIAWWRYERHVIAANVAPAVLAQLTSLSREFVFLGHVLPLGLMVLGYMADIIQWIALSGGALTALVAGWRLKWLLVTRLSRFDGFGLGSVRRGHPLRIAGRNSMSDLSPTLHRTRENVGRCSKVAP